MSDLDKDISEAQNALQEWKHSSLPRETVICECYCVSVGDVLDICPQALDLELLAERFGLGTGCKSCLKDMPRWHSLLYLNKSEGATNGF
jgi:NAD(P)H-nitrite reductase large subunit